MPTTGNELISYQGNSGLGLGGNADVPAIDSSANLNPILDAGKNIMLLDADRNMRMFQQKVKDRDKRLELLDQGQIASGDLLDKDKPIYENAKKKTNEAFYKMIDAGGLNNPKAYKDYMDTVTELKDTVTHLQGRYLDAKTIKQDQAKETIPSKIKDYQDWYDKQLDKPSSQLIDPYQHLLDFKNDEVTTPILNGALSGGSGSPTATTDRTTVTTKNGKTSTTQTETTGAAKGKQQQPITDIVYKNGLPYSRTKQRYSLGKMNENATEKYLEPESQAQMNLLVQKIPQLPPYQQQDALTHLIQRAEDYNRDNGYTEGRDKDAAPVSKYKKALGYDNATGKVMPNPVTGKYDIGLPAPEFAALWTLGHVNGNYAPSTDTYLKDEAQQSEKNLHDRAMEGIGREKANAYSRLTNFKLSQAKTVAEQNQALDDMYRRNYNEQQNLITTNDIPEGGKIPKFTFNDIPANKSLPMYTIEGKVPAQLKPFGAETVHSTEPIKNQKGDIIGYPKGDKITYKGGYFKPLYMRNGKQISTDDLSKAYKYYKSNNPDYNGDIQQFLKEGIADKKSGIQVQTQGENGATDEQLNTAAQRIINNLDTKKGQEGVFSGDSNPPTDDNSESATEEDSSSTNNNSNTVVQ